MLVCPLLVDATKAIERGEFLNRQMDKEDFERTTDVLIMLSSGVHAYRLSGAEGGG